MFNTTEKKERSLGVKLFLKPVRCLSPKCVTVRRPTRPGAHAKGRRGTVSEYGEQLREKQKFQFSYGLKENQLKRIFRRALRNPEATGKLFLSILERRLDNVVFRLGFAPSRSVARQLISHGHIMVGSHRVTSPSYLARPGDVIFIREQSRSNQIFRDLASNLKKYNPPSWLKINPETWEGKVESLPKDFEESFDVNKVVDYYSKIVK